MDNPAAPIPPTPPQPAVSSLPVEALAKAGPAESPNRRWLLWSAIGLIFLVLGAALGVFGVKFLNQSPTQSQISSYEDCLTAKGSLVQRSYPATCITTSGQRFVQPVSDPTFFPTATPTETADSTVSWETYISTKVPELSHSAFSIKYPNSWIKSIEYLEPGRTSGYFTLHLTKGDYKISIIQGAAGGAMCLFDNEPDYNGPAIDYRQKVYTDIDSSIGILRRVKTKSPNALDFDICQDNRSKLGHFVLPTSVGGIGYKVPLSSSSQVLAEMDDIVGTIKAR